MRRRGLRHLVVVALMGLIGSLGLATGAPPARAANATTIAVNGASPGRTFDGIGAISGGGGNSRLLTDYPAAQRDQILNYLFTPGYGASLQILKVEIGGDTNSTDGSESSIEHTAGTVDCDTGYEFWLMKQAKARNPNIKLYGLAWGAPGWIDNGNFWSTDTITYLVNWLGCAKKQGLTINYLGGWNERGYNVAWYEQLRSTLDADGYGAVQIVGADSDWSVANDVADNPDFAKAVNIIGVHYPCEGGDGGSADTCPGNATAESTGKQLWASENGSQDMNTGAPALIRSITRGYLDADLTAYINWPLVAAVYPNLPYNTVGLITANQPWSGNYSVGESLWTTAQVTQFTQPGWQFLDSGSGYLGGSESNGSYVTLKSTNDRDYSTIIETTTATAPQTVQVNVSGGLSAGTVHVWTTDVNTPSPATSFVHTQDLTPSHGSYSLTVQPGYVYTLTTTRGQGKGEAQSPPRASLALPYRDDFDTDTIDQQPTYLAQQQGAFEVEPCDGGRAGRCVRQQAPVTPIEWDNGANPYTIGGDLSWSNYTVSADAYLAQAGAVQLLGRVGGQAGFNPARINDYYLQVSDTGAWSIVKNTTGGTLTTLASGTVTALGTGSWHHLALSFDGSTISAAIDGTTVGSVTDTSYAAGMVGLGVDGYQTDEFDNLAVTPIGTPTYDAAYQLTNRASGKALAVTGDSAGARVVQATPADDASQEWELAAPRAGLVELVNVASGKALTLPSQHPDTALTQRDATGVADELWRLTPNQSGDDVLSGGSLVADVGHATAAGTAVIGDRPDGRSSQQWQLTAVPVSGATYTLHNQRTGWLMDVNGQSTTPGAMVIQWPANGGANQEWTLRSNGDGTWSLVNVNSQQLLDVAGASTSSGAGIVQEPANGGADQRWELEQTSGGIYTLINVGSGLVIDNGGSSTQGTQLIQSQPTGSAQQQWQLVPTS
jgi:hypothetical protein